MKNMKIMKFAAFLLVVMSVNVCSMEKRKVRFRRSAYPDEVKFLKKETSVEDYVDTITADKHRGYASALSQLSIADYSHSDKNLYQEALNQISEARDVCNFALTNKQCTWKEAIDSFMESVRDIIWLNYKHLWAAIRTGVIPFHFQPFIPLDFHEDLRIKRTWQ